MAHRAQIPAPSENLARSEPQIQHSFVGDTKVLNGTFDTRAEIRNALKALIQDVQRHEYAPVQVQADIKIRVGTEPAKEYTYSVTLTEPDFDSTNFSQHMPQPSPDAQHRAANSSRPPNGKQATPVQSTPGLSVRRPADDDDLMEIRPFKRPRTDGVSTSPPRQSARSLQQLDAQVKDATQLYDFMKSWHTEWQSQGGWLFDNVTKMTTADPVLKLALEQKLGEVQDVLGQSINSASASTMNELGNIAKLIPWLENCRKIGADKVQTREEKWRTSSATFHDQSRRDRETAEKRIERKLEEQRELLMKIAKASGLGLEDEDAAGSGGAMASREESLGAQLTAELTAELSTEASRARPVSKYDAHTGTITIDDDT